MIDIQKAILDNSNDAFDITSSEEARATACALAQHAQRALYIHTRHFDRRVYDHLPFLEAIKQLAINHRRATVRVLVQDSAPIVRHGHRFITLAHRLSSSIQIRKPAEEFKGFNDAFFVVDEVGFMLHRPADRYEGIVNVNSPGKAMELVRYFEMVWRHSQPDPKLRRLTI